MSIITEITEHKIPLGKWMEHGVDWLTDNASGLFDAISFLLQSIIMFLVDVFKWMPPAAPILITAAIACVITSYSIHYTKLYDGNENAAVLPVPVCALPKASRPSNRNGIAAA